MTRRKPPQPNPSAYPLHGQYSLEPLHGGEKLLAVYDQGRCVYTRPLHGFKPPAMPPLHGPYALESLPAGRSGASLLLVYEHGLRTYAGPLFNYRAAPLLSDNLRHRPREHTQTQVEGAPRMIKPITPIPAPPPPPPPPREFLQAAVRASAMQTALNMAQALDPYTVEHSYRTTCPAQLQHLPPLPRKPRWFCSKCGWGSSTEPESHAHHRPADGAVCEYIAYPSPPSYSVEEVMRIRLQDAHAHAAKQNVERESLTQTEQRFTNWWAVAVESLLPLLTDKDKLQWEAVAWAAWRAGAQPK